MLHGSGCSAARNNDRGLPPHLLDSGPNEETACASTRWLSVRQHERAAGLRAHARIDSGTYESIVCVTVEARDFSIQASDDSRQSSLASEIP